MTADITLIIEALDKTQGTFNAISAGAAIALGGAVKIAVDFDTAISGASRALDLSGKEVDAFAASAKEIAPALGLAPTKFAQLSAEAGKLGVAKNDIVGFAKNIAELGLITDSTDEQVIELASSFAAIKTITGATNRELEIAGATFNALDDRIGGNVRGITEFTRQTAAAGKLLKLTIGDLGAYGATFGALGVKEAVAYRSFNSLLTKLAAPQVLSKAGRDGLATLGIASDDLAKRMTTNANGGIDFFLGRIRELAKTDVSAALAATKQVIGADFGDEILTLAIASDKYKDALAIVGNESASLAKKQDELAKKANSVKGQMAIASATAQVLGINLGAALLPALVGILQAVTPLVKGFADLVAVNPIIGQITVGALLLLAAIAPIAGIITGISGAMAALAPLAAGVAGISFLPFVLGAIAVGAVAGVIVANWSPISTFFSNLWTGIVGTTNSAMSAIMSAIANTWNWISSSISALINSAYSWGTSFISTFGQGLWNAFNSVITNFQSQLAYLRSFLPSSDAERGALSDLSRSGRSLWETFSQGLNTGIPVAERAIASGSSQLLPTPNLSSGSSGSSSNQSIVINFSPSVSGNTTPDLIEALRVESRRLLDMLQQEGDRLNRGGI